MSDRHRHRVVIVGASLAGLTVAESLRSEGFDGDVVLLGDETHLPYSRPPLSKQVLLETWEPELSALRTQRELDDLGIEFRGSSAAIGLDVSRRVVTTVSGSEQYDDVVIATGTRARRVWEQAGVLTLRTVDDATAIRSEFRRARRIAVLGAGVLGSEIASAARHHGRDVTLVGRSARMTFGAVGAGLATRLERLHRDHGVRLRLGDTVTSVDRDQGGARVSLDDGSSVAADVVIAAVGGIPSTEWLTDSGLTLDDGVVCDHRGSAAPGVHAVGDVAAWRDPSTGAARRVEHQTNAIEQAMAVASTIVHDTESAIPVPFFWSDIHGAKIKAYGWFEPRHPLVDLQAPGETGALLLGSQVDGRTRGIVAWNLPPREFRGARALVDASLPAVHSRTPI